MDNASQLIDFLWKNIPQHPNDIVDVASTYFKVTRTTVHRHLTKMINRGHVIKTGNTRDVNYYLSNALNTTIKLSLNDKLEESQIYNKYFKQALSILPQNVESICYYGFTEIVNNAIDHSRGRVIWIKAECQDNTITLTVIDDGVGVFKTIHEYFKLDELKEGVLQLSKGKMTTAPKYHTGEGLFFTSRAFDTLEIYANNIHYIKNNKEQDWSFESYEQSADPVKFGSKIVMTIDMHSRTNLVDVFKAYQDPASLAFNKTEILIKLSKLGQEQLISRSQAKRVLRDIETKFKIIILDFREVKLVGQGFVDEIFRVFKNEHPDIKIKYCNANEDVEFMIKRGVN